MISVSRKFLSTKTNFPFEVRGMGNYRQIYGNFWNDSKVVNEFTPEDRYFFLYLLTNSHTNLCGCYEISYRQMAWETGYNEDTVARLMQRMEEVLKVVCYCKETREVLILNWSKYNWNSSPKLLKGLETVGSYIKTPKFKSYIEARMKEKEIPYGYPIQNEEYPMDTSNYSSSSDSVSVLNNISTNNKRFKAPTLEEIQAYCDERDSVVDPNEFFDFYTAKGWKVGNSPMKDWKAAFRTWESRRKKEKADDLSKWLE